VLRAPSTRQPLRPERNFGTKKSMTTPKENDGETLQRLADEEKELERRAAERLRPWGKPQSDDYDFRSWTKKDASKELLEAGCFYEYARESRKLRGLLT